MGCAVIEDADGGVWLASLTGTRGSEAPPSASLLEYVHGEDSPPRVWEVSALSLWLGKTTNKDSK